MTEPKARLNSLVLYRNRPARVSRIDKKKLELVLQNNEKVNVRPKDIALLHVGPIHDLSELRPQSGEVTIAWELLAGQKTSLSELAELAYGDFTPATAWAAWQIVAEGLYFAGSPDHIIVHDSDTVADEKAARETKAAEERSWAAFLARASKDQFQEEDERYLQDIAALAWGATDHSRALRALGQQESPQSAHDFLLQIGYWDERVNPYPRRAGLVSSAPEIALPPLPDEPRRDLTHLISLAIDDEGSQDPDDALSLDDGRLWVHIADVAALIKPDDPADVEARARGANLYLPEGTIPMSPGEATQSLGLGLQELSPALSFGMQIDPGGEIRDLEIVSSIIRVTRMTYRQAESSLDESPLQQLNQMAQIYQERRRQNGAVFLDFPEVKVSVENGEVLIRPLLPFTSRDLVREAMLMTGEAVACFAIEHGLPMPFSTQNPPDADIKQAKALSEMFALRRTMKPSQQKRAPGPHAGLGLPYYTRTTSPLRRYLDMIVHQQLRAYLRGDIVLDEKIILARIGASGAVAGSVRWAERRSNEHWTLVYLLGHPEWRGEGIIVDKRGTYDQVLIPELGLETQVYRRRKLPLDSIVTLALNEVKLAELEAHFQFLE